MTGPTGSDLIDDQAGHGIGQSLGAGGETVGGSAPSQLIDVRKQWGVRPKCRQFFEQQGGCATLAQDLRREVLNLAVAFDQIHGSFRADT